MINAIVIIALTAIGVTGWLLVFIMADNGHDREMLPNPYCCKKCQDKPAQGEE